MKYVLLLLAMALAACTGTSNSKNVHPKPDMDVFIEILGTIPKEVSPKEFQVVAYQTKPIKKAVPYQLHLGPQYSKLENGEIVQFEEPPVHYRIWINEMTPADEIDWFFKGTIYQTLKIEYIVKQNEIVGIKAFWGGNQELCTNLGTASSIYRWTIIMPDIQTQSDYRTIFYDDPKCRLTEKGIKSSSKVDP